MEKQKINITLTIAAVACITVAMSALVAGLLSTTYQIQSEGFVEASVGIAVYEDEALTKPLSVIKWDIVAVGSSHLRYFWIKNTGNTKVKLTMTTKDWSPAGAQSYITFSWSLENEVLAVGQKAQGHFNLQVASNAVGGNFSFTIVITGTEYSG